MKLKAVLLATVLAAPIPAFAQQTNIYSVCTNIQENYTPGYYDSNGNYISGSVRTQRYNVQCGTGTYYRPNDGNVYQSPVAVPIEQPRYRRRICNPVAGAALGAGLASALTGNSYNYGGNYYRNYNRGSYSGGWNNYGTNSNGWTLFGAGLGALMYSC